MRRLLFALSALLVLTSHDMFLKLDTYFLAPDTESEIQLYNGTFDRSENVIARTRMADVSLLGGGTRTRLDTSAWTERDSATILRFTTGFAGTYVAGVSTHAREIALAADAFNDYLAHEGGADMLASRTQDGLLAEDAVERYAKHVKAIFQVGDSRTDDWQTVLGYPVEFVPLSNPYDLHPGDTLRVRLLRDGQPLGNQIVTIGSKPASDHDHDHTHADGSSHTHAHTDDHEHAEASAPDAAHDHDHTHADGNSHTHAHTDDHEHAEASAPDATHDHDHTHADGSSHTHAHTDDHEHAEKAASDAGHTHHGGRQVRTDAEGAIAVPVSHDGVWHLRTIDLRTVDEPGLTHASNWATITFEASHEHSHAGGAHEHDHSTGLPSYVYWLGSLLLVGGLFVYFNRRR